MRGRRLATVRQIIAILKPGSDTVPKSLKRWCEENEIQFHTVPVGEDIRDYVEESIETLGVSVGGDGTFLESVKEFSPYGIPVLGVRTGTTSFLPRLNTGDLQDALDEIIHGRARIDSHQQLHVLHRDMDVTGVNEVMIRRIPPEDPVDRKITEFHVFADQEYVGTYRGTGIAVSTPTGSTGVSLSANGSVHHPRNNYTLQVVPLHTHNLGVRPLIVGEDMSIRVKTEKPVNLLVDGGRHHKKTDPDEPILVNRGERTAEVVRTSYDMTFFAAIEDRLGWGIRKKKEDRPELPGPKEPKKNLKERALDLAREAAYSVGDPLRELHGRTHFVESKSNPFDIVTEADYKSEHIITTVIQNEFPDHGIQSEEGITTNTSSRYTWMIDPLDGTGNYANGNPNYAVSIALLDEDEPIMGVVYAPETDQLYASVRGGDAMRNGYPIETTARAHLEESVIISGYDPDGEFLQHYYNETRGVRRLGCASLHLCFLASGSADAIWEYDTYPWDVAAGVLIARNAGARITDTEEKEYQILSEGDRRELLGTNGPLHPEALSHLRKSHVLRSV